jgi:hypothetical protein
MKEELVICEECEYVGLPAMKVRGSFWMEVVLGLCFLLPRLIYSVGKLDSFLIKI